MKHLIFIIICLSIISCKPECKNVYFQPNDKIWFDKYNVGDKVVFKSQLNDYDTILITKKFIKKPDGNCILFASGGFDREYARIEYEIKKDTFKLHYGWLVQAVADENKDEVPVLRFLNMEFSNQNLPEKKVSSSNPKWENVYTFNESNSNTGYGIYSIIEFEWDMKYGLVSYKNANGEKWSLERKE